MCSSVNPSSGGVVVCGSVNPSSGESDCVCSSVSVICIK